MTTTRKPLSGRIAEARKAKGLSMYAAAKIAGIPEGSWRAVERDGVEPHLFRAAAIAEVLGVSIDWLAGRTESAD